MESLPAQRGAAPRAVLLVVPPQLPPSAGNVVTAARLAQGLAAAGVAARVLPADALHEEPQPEPGTVVHALHAVAAGVPAARWARGVPVVWTFTGTDLASEALAPLQPAASGVAAFVVYHAEALAQVRALLPGSAGRLRIIPPAVAPALLQPAALRRPAHLGAAGAIRPVARPHEVVLLLPAGLRPVKDPDLAVAVLDHLRRAGVPARLWIAGPPRERGFAAEFLERIAAKPFVQHLGEVPPERMPALYLRADIVLNTSRAEGMSNALLEAMALGRAVLATDIPGNRAAIQTGKTGVLAGAAELPGAALGLAQAPHLRRRLGQNARRWVLAHCDPRREIQAHLSLYRALLAAPVERTPLG